MTQTAIQDDLQCTNCGGQCVYSPKAKALECTSCGTQRKIAGDPFGAAAREAAREFAYDPTQQDEPDLKHRTYVHHCMTCGGDVVFTGAALSDRCAYCDSPVVLATSDKAYASTAMIPFSVDQTTATQNARDWAQKRLAAPDDLGDVVDKARIVGIYVPFWTFDTQEAIKYTAKYRVKSGKITYTRSTSGAFHMKFDDLLVPASSHVTPLIRDGILHDFDPERLRPYTPGYLAGFGAERHHQTVDEGLNAFERDKDILIRNRILFHLFKEARRIELYSILCAV